jgi:hypothetical protein
MEGGKERGRQRQRDRERREGERPDSRASMRSSVSAARFSNSLASATFLSCKFTEATQRRASGDLVEIPLLHR